MTPWGVHRLQDMIGSQAVTTGLPDGRWVRCVPEPYTGNCWRAAWHVLTGRAFAVQWPKSGDLETILGIEPERLKRPTYHQFKVRP